MSTYLITGATSGLGRQVALGLAREGGHRLIVPVRSAARGVDLHRSLERAGAASVATPIMDLASLRSVSAFLRSLGHVQSKLDGVLFNAGVQSAAEIEFTEDGIESTFAVNHLANFFIADGLRDRLSEGAIVGWIASGTHDPKERSARLAGFRGARYTSAARLAKGEFEPGISVAQACKDAYATSKLCEIVSARVFAHRYPNAATFFSFDPGLMPGTELARKQPAAALWVWRHLLPRLAPLLPGTSTPARSAAIVIDLLTGRRRASFNGAYFNYTGKQLDPASPAAEAWVADDLVAASRSLLEPFASSSDQSRPARPAIAEPVLG